MHKYAPKMLASYVQLKKYFTNRKLKYYEINSDKWVNYIESLHTETNEVTIVGKTNMSEVDLIIHILANIPE